MSTELTITQNSGDHFIQWPSNIVWKGPTQFAEFHTPPRAAQPRQHMNINEQINAIIPAAKEFGMSLTELTGEIGERWNEKPSTAQKLVIDEHGRHAIPGSSKLWLTPIPKLLGMTLTARQWQNIASNCGVDEKGEPLPNFGEGFQGNIGDSYVVSMYIARDFALPLLNGVRQKFPGPEVTRRARFRSMEDAIAYVAANPWVQ